MSISKAWDWKSVQDERWMTPSEESYMLLARWKNLGFRNFLDLGCGKGRHAIFFSKEGFDVTAADLSEYSVNELYELSKANHFDIHCDVCDMMELPYQDNAFDCLLAYHVISHSNTSGVFQTMDEIHRVVRNNGEVFLTFGARISLPNCGGNFHYIEENVIVKDEDGPEKGIPHFYTDEETLKQLMRNFEVLSVRLSQNVDLSGKKQYGYHYFVLAKVIKSSDEK